ncbi:MAG: sensor histidine kinase [Jiangellales bacterium]
MTSGTSAPDFWTRTRGTWHAVFYGLLALMAVLLLALDDLDDTEVPLALGCLAVMALAYTLAGRRALGRDMIGPALAYLLPAWGAVFVLAAVAPVGYGLLFILFPQTWAMLPRTWQAVAWTLVAAGVLATIAVWQGGFGTDAAVEASLTFAFNAGLSLLLGLWITGIARESDRRAALIDELRRTQAELAEAERDRGVMAERERLAHEIHDTLAQGFTSILALARAIDAGWDADPGAARSRLALLEETACENVAEARALVAALRPVDLDDADLTGALERVVARFSRDCPTQARLEVRGQARPLSPHTEVVLLRAAQEGLTNVRKHAGATMVVVRLTYADPDESMAASGDLPATLEVIDDGRGIVPGTAEGFGLSGMRSRAAAIGGSVEVAAADEGGTRVRVDVR